MLQDPNVERCIANAIKPLQKQIKKLKAEIETNLNNELANGTKPVLADSKKNRVRCTKTLVSVDNKVCFVKDQEYDVIEDAPILILRNKYNQQHSITGEWLDFFYFY